MTHPTFRSSSARRLCVALLAALAGLSSLRAQETEPKAPRFAIAAEAGTAGFGPAMIVTVSKHFTATLGYTWLDYDYDFSDDDGDYAGKLKLSNVQFMANWHPFAGSFHISAGVFLSDNKVDATGKPKPNASFDIGGVNYTSQQVGTLNGTVELAKGAAPFVGFGWSKKPLDGGFGFFVDIGVIFTDSPSARFNATGPISSNPTFQADLRREEREVNDELDGLKHYPVAQFGVLYRF